MSHEMKIEDKIGAADALGGWFQSQDISPAQSCTVVLMYLAACHLTAVEAGASHEALRQQIFEMFDSCLRLLKS